MTSIIGWGQKSVPPSDKTDGTEINNISMSDDESIAASACSHQNIDEIRNCSDLSQNMIVESNVTFSAPHTAIKKVGRPSKRLRNTQPSSDETRLASNSTSGKDLSKIYNDLDKLFREVENASSLKVAIERIAPLKVELFDHLKMMKQKDNDRNLIEDPFIPINSVVI